MNLRCKQKRRNTITQRDQAREYKLKDTTAQHDKSGGTRTAAQGNSQEGVQADIRNVDENIDQKTRNNSREDRQVHRGLITLTRHDWRGQDTMGKHKEHRKKKYH